MIPSINRVPLQFTTGEGQIIPGVELQATYPEDLARYDISDEELDALSGEERF